jgi:hypothetical protein
VFVSVGMGAVVFRIEPVAFPFGSCAKDIVSIPATRSAKIQFFVWIIILFRREPEAPWPQSESRATNTVGKTKSVLVRGTLSSKYRRFVAGFRTLQKKRKGPVSRVLSTSCRKRGSHLSARPTQEIRSGQLLPPKGDSLCLALHRAGFTCHACYHGVRWALTPPFHISLRAIARGGLFSVALAVSGINRNPCLTQGALSCGARTFLSE